MGFTLIKSSQLINISKLEVNTRPDNVRYVVHLDFSEEEPTITVTAQNIPTLTTTITITPLHQKIILTIAKHSPEQLPETTLREILSNIPPNQLKGIIKDLRKKGVIGELPANALENIPHNLPTQYLTTITKNLPESILVNATKSIQTDHIKHTISSLTETFITLFTYIWMDFTRRSGWKLVNEQVHQSNDSLTISLQFTPRWEDTITTTIAQPEEEKETSILFYPIEKQTQTIWNILSTEFPNIPRVNLKNLFSIEISYEVTPSNRQETLIHKLPFPTHWSNEMTSYKTLDWLDTIVDTLAPLYPPDSPVYNTLRRLVWTFHTYGSNNISITVTPPPNYIQTLKGRRQR